MNRQRVLLSLLCAAAVLALPGVARATDDDDERSDPVKRSFQVSITNLTQGQQFTPLLLVTHRPPLALFTLGQPVSPELRILAEEGNVAPLAMRLSEAPEVSRIVSGAGLTNPGQTVSFTIETTRRNDRLSLAAMLIPTNDAFTALDGVALPKPGRSLSYFARAYDAGSERNDELCASIPGPFFAECGGSGGGARVGGGEGFAHVHNGIHGTGSLPAALRDWRNPVALVTIRGL